MNVFQLPKLLVQYIPLCIELVPSCVKQEENIKDGGTGQADLAAIRPVIIT